MSSRRCSPCCIRLVVILVFAADVVERIGISEGADGYSIGSTLQFSKWEVSSLSVDRFTVRPCRRRWR